MIQNASLLEGEALRQQTLLAAWFSPGFPVGGFAFSHGLEWACEHGGVVGRAMVEAWMLDVLQLGSGRQDGILLNVARRAICAASLSDIQDVVAVAAASQPSRERALEASVQGRAFLDLVRSIYAEPSLDALDASLLPRMTFPVAVGLAGGAHRLDAAALTTAYLAAFVANLASAAVRLGAVGQTDGQRIIAALAEPVRALAREVTRLTLDDLGGAAFGADLASLNHETQNARLFRS